ncbi:hypothetical protein CVT25_004848 [Psilocybe cyanescens]|uniref:RNA-dependent RNA polymerase n=1 Tax=Psilocybe cyanescens TaxID=93625 RepID=A0A409W7R2_PSICY|nr:hypothetical protein CVT25_004848 [Psilocybe cyanescens]
MDEFTSYGLRAFCHKGKILLSEQKYKEFVRFMLCGIDPTNETQVIVDAFQNGIDDDKQLEVMRDYDSLLGIDPNIKVLSSIDVFPLARHADTLTSSVHLSYLFTVEGKSFRSEIHKVPNICLGKWQTHNMLRVIIPGLFREGRSSCPTQDEQRMFYNHGLLLAMRFLLNNDGVEWCPSYDDEMFRARGADGKLSFQAKKLPAWSVDHLAGKIREYLQFNGCPWYDGIVILHQIRGVKHSTEHGLIPNATTSALIKFLQENHLLSLVDNNITEFTSSQQSQWWIDVGIEVSSTSSHCLQWKSNSHADIVQQVCRVSEATAVRLTKVTRPSYRRDLAQHLMDVSGFRLIPGERGQGVFECQYMQAYTTDKAVTYCPTRSNPSRPGKSLTALQIMRGSGRSYMSGLYDLYKNCRENNYSLARLELRVPLKYAHTVLYRDIDDHLLRKSLLSFDRPAWWYVCPNHCS